MRLPEKDSTRKKSPQPGSTREDSTRLEQTPDDSQPTTRQKRVRVLGCDTRASTIRTLAFKSFASNSMQFIKLQRLLESKCDRFEPVGGKLSRPLPISTQRPRSTSPGHVHDRGVGFGCSVSDLRPVNLAVSLSFQETASSKQGSLLLAHVGGALLHTTWLRVNDQNDCGDGED